jgi:hypothetical protein
VLSDGAEFNAGDYNLFPCATASSHSQLVRVVQEQPQPIFSWMTEVVMDQRVSSSKSLIETDPLSNQQACTYRDMRYAVSGQSKRST